jgi:Raf kinase inhibitor-like YbhB/YbcL family protein
VARTHQNISPALQVSGVPPTARSLALILDDPDAPGGLFTHWLVWNVPPNTALWPEGHVPAGAVEGHNSFGGDHYDGPAPPNGRHRYFFHLYALDASLNLPAGSDLAALDAAMQGHVLAQAETFGTFATGE